MGDYWKNVPDSMVAEYAPIWWRAFRRFRDNSRETAYFIPPPAINLNDSTVLGDLASQAFTEIMTWPVYVPDCYVGTTAVFFQIHLDLTVTLSGGPPYGIGTTSRWKFLVNAQESATYEIDVDADTTSVNEENRFTVSATGLTAGIQTCSVQLNVTSGSKTRTITTDWLEENVIRRDDS